MLILFPSEPGHDTKIDQAFDREYRAAVGAGFDTAVVNVDTPYVGGVPLRPGETAIYRGWMLSLTRYTELYQLLWERGVKLINSPAEYKYAHELPGWYDDLGGSTPKTVWFGGAHCGRGAWGPQEADWPEIVTEVQRVLGDGPYIVKDFVKSRKHEWEEACFIEGPGDIERVAKCFLERQGEDLVGGLVFREFVTLKEVGQHPKSGIPLFDELRTWTVRGAPLINHTYWGPDEGGAIVVPRGLITFVDLYGEGDPKTKLVSWRVKSNFYTMDIAMLKGGGWVVIELGDGQVAGLPDHVDAELFYRDLRAKFV